MSEGGSLVSALTPHSADATIQRAKEAKSKRRSEMWKVKIRPHSLHFSLVSRMALVVSAMLASFQLLGFGNQCGRNLGSHGRQDCGRLGPSRPRWKTIAGGLPRWRTERGIPQRGASE